MNLPANQCPTITNLKTAIGDATLSLKPNATAPADSVELSDTADILSFVNNDGLSEFTSNRVLNWSEVEAHCPKLVSGPEKGTNLGEYFEPTTYFWFQGSYLGEGLDHQIYVTYNGVTVSSLTLPFGATSYTNPTTGDVYTRGELHHASNDGDYVNESYFVIKKQKDSYPNAGTFNWQAPTGVSSVDVRCYGGGGAGFGISNTVGSRPGGGGGQMAANSAVTVIAGNTYSVVVGAGGTSTTAAGTAGGDSSFGGSLVLAKGGGAASVSVGGSGSIAGSISTLKYNGGNGCAGVTGSGYSGGGGGGGGYAGAGTLGQLGLAAPGGAAGTGTAGGSGAVGYNTNHAGNAGTAPGGGGSGAKATAVAALSGGPGAKGLVEIRYIVP